MKTFEEAFAIVKIQCDDAGDPDPVEIANVRELGRTVVDFEPFRDYVTSLVSMIRRRRIKSAFRVYETIATTAFVAGVRVGQEMEKQ